MVEIKVNAGWYEVTVSGNATEYTCIWYVNGRRYSETFATIRYDPPPALPKTWLEGDPPPTKIKSMPLLPMARWVRESVRRRV